MRGDVMVWVGRLVGAVFVLGLLALIAAVVVLVQRAEGVPPLPLFMGLMGVVVLILLSGACLALISLAVSARRGAEALQRLSGQRIAAPVMRPAAAPAPEPAAEAEMQGPFSPVSLRDTAAAAAAPARPARPGRVLVAER